jgi:hypothetical protein
VAVLEVSMAQMAYVRDLRSRRTQAIATQIALQMRDNETQDSRMPINDDSRLANENRR